MRLPLFRVLFLLTACSGTPSTPRLPAPWLDFIVGDSLTAALDTSRLAVLGDTVDVWIRLVPAVSVPLPNDSMMRFSLTDAEERVHCASRRAQDVRILVRGSAGDSLGGFTAAGVSWQRFEDHPLSERVFVPLCAALEKQSALRAEGKSTRD